MKPSWATFRQEIERARDSCTAREWQVDWLGSAFVRFDRSVDTLTKLRNAVTPCLDSASSQEVGVFACGSFGRLEASVASDLDLLMVTRRHLKDVSGADAQRYHDCMARVIDAVASVVPHAFDGKGSAVFGSADFQDSYLARREYDTDLYRRWVPEDVLLDNRFDLSDTALRQVRRVSVLLEAEPIANNEFSETFRLKALTGLYGIDLDSSGMIRTARSGWNLFARELARFLQTCHFLHEHKMRREGKPPLVRSTKLPTTRRMLALSALFVLLEAEHRKDVVKMLLAPPIVRLCSLLQAEISASRSTSWPPTLQMLKWYVSHLDEIDYERQFDQPATEFGERHDEAFSMIGYSKSEFDQMVQAFLEFRQRHRGQDLRSLLTMLT